MSDEQACFFLVIRHSSLVTALEYAIEQARPRLSLHCVSHASHNYLTHHGVKR
jgi:hypothetical protein